MVTPLHSSLHKRLFEPESGQRLNWKARSRILIGVAEGLAYLHDGLPDGLVHCDIKPGNILFNSITLEAYIADFGTVKLMQGNLTEMITRYFAGTTGYMCPVYRQKLIRSPKSDVYSFGALLFVLVAGSRYKGEILQGQMVCDLVEASRSSFVIESKFRTSDGMYREREFRRALRVARSCTKKAPRERPSMKEVVMMLNGSIRQERSVVERIQDEIDSNFSIFSLLRRKFIRTVRNDVGLSATSQGTREQYFACQATESN